MSVNCGCECVGDCAEKKKARIKEIHAAGKKRRDAKKAAKKHGRMSNADFEKAFKEVPGWRGCLHVEGARQLLLEGNPGDFCAVMLPGERVGHWVALVINSDGTSYWFDSFGRPPVITGVSEWNRQRMQQRESFLCGLFSLEFIRAWRAGLATEYLGRFADPAESDRILLELAGMR